MANENLMLNEDLNIIQKLGDEPNADNNLTASELKAKFDEAGNIIKKHINEVLVPDSAGKVPNTRKVNGKALSSDITLTAADVDSAPAGYGLGVETPVMVENPDDAVENGWYQTTDPFNGGAGWLFVTSYSPNYKIQYALNAKSKVRAFIGQRIMYGGSWGEWEYINPPMLLGVEYRTTERFNGKPVYVKAVDFGAMPNATSKKVAHGVSNFESCIDIYGCFDVWNLDATEVTSYYANTGNIVIKTNTDCSTYTAKVVIKYTKTTD